MRGLVAQGTLEEEVTEQAEREDAHGESVACPAVASEGTAKELGAVFWRDVRDGAKKECVGVWDRMDLCGQRCCRGQWLATSSQTVHSSENLLPEGRVKGNGSGRDCCGTVSSPWVWQPGPFLMQHTKEALLVEVDELHELSQGGGKRHGGCG